MNFKSFILKRKLTFLNFFIIIVPLTISIIFYQSSKDHQKEVLDLFKSVSRQTEVYHRMVSSLSDFQLKNALSKKNLQVFISDINRINEFNEYFINKINDNSAIKDLIPQKLFDRFSFISKDLDNNLAHIIEIQNKTKSNKLADSNKIRKILLSKKEYSELIDSLENILFDEIEVSAKQMQKSLLITFCILLGAVIYIGILIIKSFFPKINKLTNQIELIESKYALLTENSEELIIKIKINGTLVYVSPSCMNFLGYSETELNGKSILEFLDLESTLILKNHLEVSDFSSQLRLCSQISTKSGRYIWSEIIIKPSRLVSADEMVCILKDVTSKKILEDSLNESQTKYQAVFDNMFDGFAYYKVLLDEKDQTEDYLLLEVNDAFEGLTGLKRENVVGRKLTEIFPGIKESRYNWIGKYDNVALHGEKIRFQYYAKNIERWHNISAYSPIKGYFVTLFEDITQRKVDEAAINHYITEMQNSKEKIENDAKVLAQLNIKLKESEKMLKELNANKDKFFSIIAHDLRTPFNALTGLSELLSNQIEVLSVDEIKEYSSNIHSSSVKLFSLLENLLKWSGLQSGRIVKVPTHFYIDSLILSITELYKNNIGNKGINLVLDLAPDVKVYADKDMIETVLRNLLSNAIKFTNKDGIITIIMRSGSSFTEVTFSDTGIGIDQSIIKKLFKLSEHITSSGTENEKGTGLGLILCKEFIEKNGGKITVCSEPGKGSKFTFTIPK